MDKIDYQSYAKLTGSNPFGTQAKLILHFKELHQYLVTNVPDIEIWGDGKQTRSFLYIDDAIDGLMHLMESDCPDPLNIGSDEMVTIDELLSMVEEISGISLNRLYNLDAPKGVRGRSSDNSLVKRALGWSPRWSLRNGLKPTYDWIYEEIVKAKVKGTKR